VVQFTRPRVVHIERPWVVHIARPRPVQTTRPSLVQYSPAGDTMTVLHFAECVAGKIKIDLQTILKVLKAILKGKAEGC